MHPRREGWKRLGLSMDQNQERRRQDAMERQKQARRDLTMHVRSLALPSVDSELEDLTATMMDAEMEVSMAASKSRKKTREDRVKARRSHYSNQLMHPEWMVDIPSTLVHASVSSSRQREFDDGWLVLPRPDGKRCLVIASNGSTVARTVSGSVLKKFPSALPCGSRKTNAGQDQYCVLDCIFHEASETFCVLDVMCWKGYLLYDCTVDFRQYWLRDKLAETTAATITNANPYAFEPVPSYDCTVDGLIAAHATTFSFTKDGLLFYCKAGMYTPGLTPLVLLWRDADTSQYENQLSVVLEVDDDGLACATSDHVVMYTFTPEQAKAEEVVAGDLVRVSVESIEWGGDGDVEVTGAVFQKRCSPQRGVADSWTKLAHVGQTSCSFEMLLSVLREDGHVDNAIGQVE
ncbi:hypothetical protein, variant [Aphanomyces invadans]|uniref:Snurportin-1 n=1 Tax=Aphanomyces invadans TaxID=157072 RepID=A0A024TAB7_9STRA|nr:hypothetical protein, variant [Aphanomyces invadans]XP_008880817.1 hypothetical protein H310_14691 [Aphanomyces invadans]ETV90566.1 hypothetical protein H310_14691 [Aphanomyces invadans]ETV90567.1 hypothetical protein, variant [Aphanomyces invadans]|eukprot:XP_008880816.1 hypothetical protein, variant [Aphanomyces invadans]